MAEHDHHDMHENSLEGYSAEQESGRIPTREQSVYACYTNGKPLMDREVRDMLGMSDMNSVRPRITGLVKTGFLRECGKMKDPVTGRKVRIVRRVPKQTGLF
jgi:hypothetical protein